MCGRFTLKTPAETLASLFDLINLPPLVPRYNIAPTQPILAIRQSESTTVDSAKTEGVLLRWGLVPSWSRDLKIGARMINARSETVATKPSFRAAFKRRRCLIVTDGFYEWKKLASGKQPYYITRQDNQPFCFAGLWESWTDPDSPEGENAENKVQTATVLTTTPNQLMEQLHDRMPVILDGHGQNVWLDRTVENPTLLERLLVPLKSDDLIAFPVSNTVNKPTHDSPDCIIPLTGKV